MAIVGDLPFVLSLSKHENDFFSTLLSESRCGHGSAPLFPCPHCEHVTAPGSLARSAWHAPPRGSPPESHPHDLNDLPVMLSHRLVDDLVMHVQQPQHARFVSTHQRLKPTMSVNMMAASLRVSAGRVLALSSGIGTIIG